MIALSPPVRRFAALGVAAVLVLLFYTLVIQPVLDKVTAGLGGGGVAGSSPQTLTGKYQQLLNEKPAWEGFIEEVRTGKYSRYVIHHPNKNLGAAQFQADIKQAIEAAHGNIQSIAVTAGKEDAAPFLLTVTVDYAQPLSASTAFFEKLRQDMPYVMIGDISVTAPEAEDASTPDPMLSVQGTFNAYLLTDTVAVIP